MSDNRREFTRAPVRLEATLYTEDHQRFDGTLVDLSMGGAFLKLEHRPDPNAACRIVLRLCSAKGCMSLHAAGVVVRIDSHGVGVRVDSVDEDAYMHMRRLVLLNAEDPERVEDELAAHSGVRPRDGKEAQR